MLHLSVPWWSSIHTALSTFPKSPRRIVCALLVYLSGGISAVVTAQQSVANAPSVAVIPSDGAPLSLAEAIARALAHNPALTAAALESEAAGDELRQAAARPNPELEIEAEEFGGTKDRRGYRSAETTLRLSQTFETGGKRAGRRLAATAEKRRSDIELEMTRLDIIERATLDFIDVLAAQERLALADQALELAEELHRAAGERVRAGKVAEIEEVRSEVEVASAQQGKRRAAHEIAVAKRVLAANWGGEVNFGEALGELGEPPRIGEVADLENALAQAPDLRLYDSEIEIARAASALARAQRRSDVDASVGISRFEDDRSYAATVALAIPLPVFDRNRGAIAASEKQMLAAEARQKAARLQRTAEFTRLHGDAVSACAEIEDIRAQLLPAAQRAFLAASDAYREGKYSYLDVVAAQRSLLDIRQELLERLTEYHRALAALERLAGTHTDFAQQPQTKNHFIQGETP